MSATFYFKCKGVRNMDVFGKYYTFNGISSSKYNVMLCSFESSYLDRETGLNYETNRTDITVNKPTVQVYNKKYSDVLQFDITLIRNNQEEFSAAERREIVSWMTSPDSPTLFTITDCEDDGVKYHENIEYFCVCVGCSEKFVNGVVGLVFSMECNAPYGFSPIETTNFISTTSTTVTINNTSDELNQYYYPIITVRATGNGTVKFTNNQFPDESMEIQMVTGQSLTIDNMLGNIVDESDLFDYSTDTNLVWLKLKHGENKITITGNATGSIKCRYVRKVGI